MVESLQTDLFQTGIDTPIPGRRATDPETSRAAERTADIGGQRRIVLNALLDHPGLTSFELDRIIGFVREVSHRRLPELERLGLVRTGAARLCSARRTLCRVWYPTKPEK